jgi:hypothetical protein
MAISLAYSSGEEGGNFLVQMIFTCRPYVWRKGGRGRHPVGQQRQNAAHNSIERKLRSWPLRRNWLLPPPFPSAKTARAATSCQHIPSLFFFSLCSSYRLAYASWGEVQVEPRKRRGTGLGFFLYCLYCPHFSHETVHLHIFRNFQIWSIFSVFTPQLSLKQARIDTFLGFV